MFCFERRQPFPFSRAGLVLGVVSALLGAECPGARWAPGMPPSGCSDVPCFLVPKVSPASRTISPFVSSGLRSEAGRPWEAMWPPSPLPHPEVVSVLAWAVVPVGAANECPSALHPADPSLFPMLWAKRCWFAEVRPSRATEGPQRRWEGQAAAQR